MKRNVLLAAMMLTAGSLLAADPKDDVTGAAKKLADAPNYSWKQTTENAAAAGRGGGGRGGFGGGPVEGKADKDGLVYRKMTFGQNEFETVNKGTNGAFNGQDGWQTFADMAAANGGGGGGRRGGGFGAAPLTPAQQAQDLLKQVKELKEFGGAYVGDLTEEGAKAQAAPQFGGRRGGGGAGGGGGFTPPEVTGAKGSVKFWVKDGVLSKYELKVEGKTTNFQGDPQDINRTTTVEIKDVGTTKIEIPDDIKKKIS